MDARGVALIALLCIEFGFRSSVALASSPSPTFDEFVSKFGRSYASVAEYEIRAQVYRSNLELIAKLNDQPGSALFSVNKFADMTPSEFSSAFV